jgi:hypothetical protein
MGFRMIEPWKHPRSEVLWFRKRVPEKFVALMGRREIKFSLGTKDPDEARLRCVEENLKLERTWQEYAEGRPRGRDLDYRQIVALAGEFYRELIERHQSNPGKADAWEASIERDRKLRKLPHFPLPRPQHHRMLFGAQVEAFLASKGLTLTTDEMDKGCFVPSPGIFRVRSLVRPRRWRSSVPTASFIAAARRAGQGWPRLYAATVRLGLDRTEHDGMLDRIGIARPRSRWDWK